MMFIKYLVSITSLIFASYSLNSDYQEVRILQAEDRRGERTDGVNCCATAGQTGTQGLVRKNNKAAATWVRWFPS